MKRLLKGSYTLFIFSMLAAVGGALFQLTAPLVIRFSVDSVIGDNAPDAPNFVLSLINGIGGVQYLKQNLWLCAAVVVLAAVCEGLCSFVRGYASAKTAENIAKNLRDKLFSHIQKLPYAYHVRAKTGELVQRCTSDVDTVRKFFNTEAVEIARVVALVFIAVYIMLGISVKMTLISVISAPFIFTVAVIFFIWEKKAFLKCDEKEGELSAVLQENLSGVRVVRAFGRQKYEVEKFNKKSAEMRDLHGRLVHLMAYYFSVSDLVCFSQITVILIVGIFMVIGGELSLGSLIVFNSYIGMLLWPLRHLGRVLADMGRMQISLGRIYEILDEAEETDTQGAAAHALNGDIEFADVNFAYEDGKTVLNNLSFTVKKGETVAILGATGSGKSTIMHILLRLYDYQSGSVRINGREITQITKEHLRRRIGIVLQEPFLFSKTIRENIKMANPEASDNDVYRSSKIAAFHDTTKRFEQGYDTIVGEKGVTLSGGQKQRVAIARAVIRQSDILIFDDSLSALDVDTDAQIRRSLKERAKGVTTFIISQRITTLQEADRILVMEHGRITQQGTHAELIKRDGLYRRVWEIQNYNEDEDELH